MRPSILNPLFAPVSSLSGVGPKLAAALAKLLRRGGQGDATVRDLLFHMPSGMVDRRASPGIALAAQGQVATLKVLVDRHEAPPPGNRRSPYRVYVNDDTGEMALTFFHGQPKWLVQQLPIGATRYVSGEVDWFNGRPTMTHPHYIVAEENLSDLPAIEPAYPLTQGVSRKVLGKALGQALARLPEFPLWLDHRVTGAFDWPPVAAAFHQLHHPAEPRDCAAEGPARSRLAYDELLAGQLALALMRAKMKRSAGRAWADNGGKRAAIAAALPYDLTGAQSRALDEILADMASSQRMLRLLQGDVGAGKTIVALMACAAAVEAGGQAAIMAPTEILARQHLASIMPLAVAAGMSCAILTGREKGATRRDIYERLASGEIDIIVGTHALFQDEVEFANLALGIVDEQHRFGVHQRLALASKGGGADILVMTATPIPRTLVLTYFGDMDVSILDEKPANRQRITTNALPLERLDDVVSRLRQAVFRGEKAYWICPLVEDNDELPITSAETRHESLSKVLPGQVGLVHGRMNAPEKDAAMADFAEGRSRVLIATTVVEVGVDVPDATIMIIEHAERFGLAQLHQLRGRVGRGDKPSTCLLLYKSPLGETAQARIKMMRESDDGFRLAEEDLRLRGEGEVLGTRQSGTPGFAIADPEIHRELLALARDDARLIVEQDAGLTSERGEALRVLLYLHAKDEAIRLLRAG